MRLAPVLTALLLSLSAQAADLNAEFSPDMVLVISGDTQGKTDPCGCKHNPRGGLGQKAQMLKDETTGIPTLFLDAGNSLLPKSVFDSEPEKFRLGIMGGAIAQANAGMQAAALGLASKDFGLGASWLLDTLKARPSSWVLTNLTWPKDSTGTPPTVQVRELAGKKVAFLSVISPTEMGVVKGPKATDPATAVKAALASLPQPPDFVVLMSELEAQEDSQLLAAVPQVSVLVKNRNGNGTERISANALVIQLPPEGKVLARVAIDLDQPWSLQEQADRLEEEKRLRTMGETLLTYRVNGDPELAYKDKPEVLSFYRKYVEEEKKLKEKLEKLPSASRPYRLAWLDVAADHPADPGIAAMVDEAKKKAGISTEPKLLPPGKLHAAPSAPAKPVPAPTPPPAH